MLSKKLSHLVNSFVLEKKKRFQNNIYDLDISKTMGDNWLFPSFEDYTGK
jgi:hypothetical protein